MRGIVGHVDASDAAAGRGISSAIGGVLSSLGIGLAYLIWYYGVRQIGNTRTATYSNLVPVVALAAAWIQLGEVPAAGQLLGAAVILGGITLAQVRRRRKLPLETPTAA